MQNGAKIAMCQSDLRKGERKRMKTNKQEEKRRRRGRMRENKVKQTLKKDEKE